MNNETYPTTGGIAEDAQTLLAATSHIAEERVVAARNRLATALQNGCDLLGKVQDRAIAGAKATDQTIRKYPYEALGLALSLGTLLGFLLSRRK